MIIDYVGLNLVSYILLKALPLVLMGVLIFNLIQRRFIPNWGKKRMATFYIAIMVTALIAFAFLIYRFRLTDWLLIPCCLVLVYFAVTRRKSIFPFALNCEKCGQRLTPYAIFFKPENVCKLCTQKVQEQEPENPI